MITNSASRLFLGAVVAAGLCLSVPALSAPVATAAPADPCAPAFGTDDTAPSQSCTDQKQACMSGSVQEGTYGERYVPPDAVAMCMEAYRDCINANSDSVG